MHYNLYATQETDVWREFFTDNDAGVQIQTLASQQRRRAPKTSAGRCAV
jgi:hypothetical protein